MSESGNESQARPFRDRPGFRDPNLRLVLWRLALAASLAAFSGLLHLFGSQSFVGPGVVGALGLLFTSIAVAWVATLAGAPTRMLLVLQHCADIVCLGFLIHFTGGPYSAFPLVFCLPIMFAAYFLDARWSMVMAGSAAIVTGGGHFGLALGWLLTGTETTLDYLSGWPVLVTAVHMSVFIVTGMVSGNLARRLARRRREQVHSQIQIQKARCEVRNILDNIRSGLITIDGKGVVTRVNQSCCDILKLPESEMLGRDIELVMADGMEELAAIIKPVAAGENAVSRGEVTVRRFGREMPLGLNVNHVTSPTGRVIGAITIFTDLTKEKEMSARIRESDRLAAVGELAASIAHEIRNPLASIRGSIEILAGELELAGYQEQLLDLVLKESGRVNTIINDFLAYSRMRPAMLRRFQASEFSDEITFLIQQHVNAKSGFVRVTCDIFPEDMTVIADPEQLTQLTLNLAINACEAMGYRGNLRIALNLVGGGDHCELVVTDNGPGIEPEIRENLFSPFKTTKEGGTGLGLSSVARIASSHGGLVRAEDGPGGGTIFRVRWPQDPDLVPEERAVGHDFPVDSGQAAAPITETATARPDSQQNDRFAVKASHSAADTL